MNTINSIQLRINRINQLLNRIDSIPVELSIIHGQMMNDISASHFTRLLTRRNNLIMELDCKTRELENKYCVFDFEIDDDDEDDNAFEIFVDEEDDEKGEPQNELWWQLVMAKHRADYNAVARKLDNIQRCLFRSLSRGRFIELVEEREVVLKEEAKIRKEMENLQRRMEEF